MTTEHYIRGIDNDEYEFLNDVDRARRAKERQQYLEEKKEIEEVKKALTMESVKAPETSRVKSLPKPVNIPIHKKENKQAGLLANAIKRKQYFYF